MNKRIWAVTVLMLAVGGARVSWVGAAEASATGKEVAKEVAKEGVKVGKLALGEKAPEVEVVGLDGKAVTLESLAGKPVVLQFGSLTEPIFRMRAVDTEKMAGKYGEKVTFVVVYQREAHAADGDSPMEVNAEAGFGISKPVNIEERTKLAKSVGERLKIAKQMVVVDAWSDASSLRYGGYPNMTFVIDSKGNLQAGYPWMDPVKMKGAVDALLAGKAVPAEFRGKTAASAPGQLDFVTAAREMGGYRGSALALTLDRLTLTEKQKTAIYPALGEYLAEAKDFREKYGGGKKGAAASAPVAAKGEMMDAGKKKVEEKAVPPEELQKAMETFKEKATKLKAALKENLAEKDARELIEILGQGPAKRMFAD